MKVEPFDEASGSNEFLYKESKRARLDREKVSSFQLKMNDLIFL